MKVGVVEIIPHPRHKPPRVTVTCRVLTAAPPPLTYPTPPPPLVSQFPRDIPSVVGFDTQIRVSSLII